MSHWRVIAAVSAALGCRGPGDKGRPSPSAGDSAAQDSAARDTGRADTAAAPGWRSRLYPEDWAPGFGVDGWALVDFSHAGYHADGRPLPAPGPEGAYAAVDFGGDPTGATDATDAIQRAVDAAAAAGGGVVWLGPGAWRVDGQVTVRASGIVLAGAGPAETRLVFPTAAGRAFDAHIRFLGAPMASRSAALAADAGAGMDRVAVAAGHGIVPGDEVQVGWSISEDFRADHGMQGHWGFSAGAWRPFFRRTVLAVLPGAGGDAVDELQLDVPLRYPALLRDGARVDVVEGLLSEVGLVGVGVSDATARWEDAWAESQAHVVWMRGVKDGFVSRVESFAGPQGDGAHHLRSGGLLIEASRRVTVADVRLSDPQHRGEGGNGYLFEVRQSNEVLIRDAEAARGRHNFIVNWDFGASGVVFLRTRSVGGEAFTSATDPLGTPACSEYHHALAMANLVDDSWADDCWKAVNRLSYSSGAGHTATESVFWNLRGPGPLTSHQYGRGYVIGTETTEVATEVLDIYESLGTAPEDHREGVGEGALLEPRSLYEDQLRRRLGGAGGAGG